MRSPFPPSHNRTTVSCINSEATGVPFSARRLVIKFPLTQLLEIFNPLPGPEPEQNPALRIPFSAARGCRGGWGGRGPILFQRFPAPQEGARPRGSRSPCLPAAPASIAHFFCSLGCNLCGTWSGDNADDPVSDHQSSLSRYCCPSLGPGPIFSRREEKKKKKKRNNGDKFRP